MDGYSNKSKFKDLDIIFLDGDIFETYKDTKHPDIFIVDNWMRMMMAFCVRYSIKLRIVEGTPGHDYKQSKRFSSLAEAFGDKLDYRYFENLAFEKMDDYGITVLYVPDEWAGSAAACKSQIIEMMETNGIEKFSIAHMHGMFDFQIPDIGEHPLKHNSEWFHSIVESYINIGHDHVFKTSGRIIVQGSFDRMAHGEEGKKGGVITYLKKDGDSFFNFIENKNARIFKTITVKTHVLDDAIEQVKKVLDIVPEDSHIRISCRDDNPILTVLDEFKRNNPKIKFKKHKDKKQQEESKGALQETIGLLSTYVPISLTKDNIIQQILENFPCPIDKPEEEIFVGELSSIL